MKVPNVEVLHRFGQAQCLRVVLVERDRHVAAGDTHHHHVRPGLECRIDTGANIASCRVDGLRGGQLVHAPELAVGVLRCHQVELLDDVVLLAARERRFALHRNVAEDVRYLLVGPDPLACGVTFHAEARTNGVAARVDVRLVAVQWNVELVGASPRVDARLAHQAVALKQFKRLGVDDIDAGSKRVQVRFPVSRQCPDQLLRIGVAHAR